ncbi:MAG: hypothetical protein AAF411_07505 [Myxococcota bacterium]
MSTLAMMGTVDTPGTPSAWLAVFLMNFTVGVLAPMVAWALWRRKGLAVWAVGIAWTVWGLAAYAPSFVLDAVDPWTTAPGYILPLKTVGVALHAMQLWLLAQPGIRAHFLSEQGRRSSSHASPP